MSTQPVPDLSMPPRLRRPNRKQLIVQPRTIDDLVPHDHPVRAIWALVQRWDLTLFLQAIDARGPRPGRAATDPCLLIALWLYATIQGIGCGRQLARLCVESDPYKWLRGGVSLNYHTLNDFRVDHEEALDDLLTQMIAVLTEAQVVTVERIAQDGTRIRASAGTNSFGERETLEKHLEEARAHLEAVKQAAADPTLSARQKAARQRGARDRQERLEQALVELEKVEQSKAQQKDKPTKDHPARASSTDPETRLMRMPDGGTRPAFNLELATDCGSRAIVGVENYLYATSQLSQTTLRSVCGQAELDELLSSREKINTHLQEILDKDTEPWGVKVAKVEIKNIDLPQEMQRAIAKQAEAERERRAKVIGAEGEFQAAQKLSDAAKIIGENPIALQLRYLQTLREVAAENNSTTIFPVPIDLLTPFMQAAKMVTPAPPGGATPPLGA